MLYDQLIKDIRKAAIAMRERKFEACAKEIKHAFIVIQQLDGLVDRQSSEPAVPWLIKFYAMLRSNILDAQVKSSAEGLDEQAKLVLDVRGAWQELDNRSRLQPVDAMSPVNSTSRTDGDATQSSWSA
jgi:flagellar biosynthetic protein FliS